MDIRRLVRFIRKLSSVEDTFDLLNHLKSEIKSETRPFSKVKEPILAFVNAQNELQLLYFQGTQVLEKTVSGVWSQKFEVRSNDLSDSQFLADLFGRPFAKLLSIPLQLKRKLMQQSIKVSALLFFEHDMKANEVAQFLDFIEVRKLPLSIALDRLLLSNDLNESSLLWERTFDSLNDPVAIFDSNFEVLRANKSFTEKLSDLSTEELTKSSFKFSDHLYQVKSYPISLGLQEHSTNLINHYVDVTLGQKLQNQMIQNEKMAALGHLAGNIAHELNNPLTGIRSLAQVLVQATPADSQLHNDLIEVESATERCQTIIRNLLEFSKGGVESTNQKVSLNDIIKKTLPLLKTMISPFDVQLDFTAENCDVFVQPQLMQQVVFNIIKNAAQAMGNSGKLSVRTFITKNDHLNAVEEGLVANISIEDTGGGVEKEIEKQIFDFFFTTKSSGQGTGIGLSMSKNIVDRFGGDIRLENQIGIGSKFIISLPILSAN